MSAYQFKTPDEATESESLVVITAYLDGWNEATAQRMVRYLAARYIDDDPEARR